MQISPRAAFGAPGRRDFGGHTCCNVAAGIEFRTNCPVGAQFGVVQERSSLGNRWFAAGGGVNELGNRLRRPRPNGPTDLSRTREGPDIVGPTAQPRRGGRA